MPNDTESTPLNSVEAQLITLGEKLWTRELTLGTAESCTGGGLSAAFTSISGSSRWFDRGVVCYSNNAKTELLGVSSALITAHGAVSEPVARAMVQGVLKHLQVDVAVSVTGIAGPDGGTAEKPVGTVFIAWATKNQSVQCTKFRFFGDRAAVRRQAVEKSIQGLVKILR